jgi:hypothetical protein
MKKHLPKVDVVSKLIFADFETGSLTWLPRTTDFFKDGKQTPEHNCAIWNGRYAHKKALTSIDSNGYQHGSLFGIKVRAHTVIWALHSGEWPSDLVDHINQDRLDNRICNLRIANKSINSMNSKIRSDNTSGYRGVTWHSNVKKWMAQVTKNGKHHYLGVFANLEDAVSARRAFDHKHDTGYLG